MERSYEDLVAWQKAMELVTATYRVSSNFPKDELFGPTSQLRRAAVSIPSNIAEGQGRLSEKEFRYFLGQSRGSLMEVETQLRIAQNLGYLNPGETDALLKNCAEVGRILNGSHSLYLQNSGRRALSTGNRQLGYFQLLHANHGNL